VLQIYIILHPMKKDVCVCLFHGFTREQSSGLLDGRNAVDAD
jgi:hypothetical protein